MVVAMETDRIDRHLVILFFVGKVISSSQQACENVVANVLWYQPKMPRGLQDEEIFFSIGIQIVYNGLGNPLENHMVVF